MIIVVVHILLCNWHSAYKNGLTSIRFVALLFILHVFIAIHGLYTRILLLFSEFFGGTSVYAVYGFSFFSGDLIIIFVNISFYFSRYIHCVHDARRFYFDRSLNVFICVIFVFAFMWTCVFVCACVFCVLCVIVSRSVVSADYCLSDLLRFKTVICYQRLPLPCWRYDML